MPDFKNLTGDRALVSRRSRVALGSSHSSGLHASPQGLPGPFGGHGDTKLAEQPEFVARPFSGITKETSVGEGEEKPEPVCTVGGSVMVKPEA